MIITFFVESYASKEVEVHQDVWEARQMVQEQKRHLDKQTYDHMMLEVRVKDLLSTNTEGGWIPSTNKENLFDFEPEQKRLVITPELRAELDQTPEWWNGLFHKALVESGVTPDIIEQGDYITERSFGGQVTVSWQTPERLIYKDCTCFECKRGL